MSRTRHFSSLFLVVALSPIFFQTTFSCERGNASLAVLEYHADEQDRIHGFSADTLEYDVFDNSPSVTVTTDTLDPASTVLYQWVVDGALGDTTGVGAGGGSAEMTLPAGEVSLRVTVRAPEGAFRLYMVHVDPPCASIADCDDGNECTDGLCDFVTSQCSFGNVTNFSTCDFSASGDGFCQDGLCEGSFCGSAPIDCSAPAGSCVSGGTCVVACDPADIQNPPCTGPAGNERCDGFGASLPAGDDCTEGGGNVCNGSGACVTCLLSENFSRCLVAGGVLGNVCTTNTDCPVTGSGGGICLPVNDNCDSTSVDCQVPSRCHGGSACTGRTQAPLGAPCSNGECDSAGECQPTP